MASRKVAQAGETELVEQRGKRTRKFLQPDGKVRHVFSCRPMHWNNGGQWADIDFIPKRQGRLYKVDQAAYTVTVDPRDLILSFTNKETGGFISFQLLALDGSPPPNPQTPTMYASNVVSVYMTATFELRVHFRAESVEIYKILHDATAAHSTTWEVVKRGADVSSNMLETKGRDNTQLSVDRTGELAPARPIEITITTTPETTLPDGSITFQKTETVTGRTQRVDADTSARTWENEIVYPVRIDDTFNVSTDNDDGHMNAGGTWYTYWGASFYNNTFGVFANNPYRAGWRFPSVNMDGSITSATLTFEVLGVAGGGSNGTMTGHEGDAPAWQSSVFIPTLMTDTAATASASFSTTGVKDVDVTDIVQEIFDTTWTSGNDLAIGTSTITGTGNNYVQVTDSHDAGTDDPVLEIVAAAAGRTTKNTDAWNLGANVGMGFRMGD